MACEMAVCVCVCVCVCGTLGSWPVEKVMGSEEFFEYQRSIAIGSNFSKVLCTVIFYSKCTRALRLQNTATSFAWVPGLGLPRHVFLMCS